MKFKEYLNFLLDIGIKCNNYKNKPLIISVNAMFDPARNLIKELDSIINTPPHLLEPKQWYNIGYILASYFGKEACKMVYGVSFEELMKNGGRNK